MTNNEIKKSLLEVISKIESNGIGAWSGNLEYTTEAVALEDYYGEDGSEASVKYNGWYEDLRKIIESI